MRFLIRLIGLDEPFWRGAYSGVVLSAACAIAQGCGGSLPPQIAPVRAFLADLAEIAKRTYLFDSGTFTALEMRTAQAYSDRFSRATGGAVKSLVFRRESCKPLKWTADEIDKIAGKLLGADLFPAGAAPFCVVRGDLPGDIAGQANAGLRYAAIDDTRSLFHEIGHLYGLKHTAGPTVMSESLGTATECISMDEIAQLSNAGSVAGPQPECDRMTGELLTQTTGGTE